MSKGNAVRAVLVALLLGFASATARAVQEELLEQARKHMADAKPYVEQANNVDLEMEQRRGPRKEAFTRLKAARDAYDKYLDANPSMEEKLDKEYCEVAALLYWIKKDSGLGELEKDAPAPTLPGGEDRAGKAPDWKDKPTPGAEPAAPTATAPTDAERAQRQFAAILDYEKKNPADLPVLLKFYEKFLADFGDPSLPEYAQAVEKLGKINDRMRGVLKEVAKRDPDTISGPESKDEKSIFGRLSQDFNAKDPEIRRRAARLMAASRTRSATYFLARGLSDKDEDLSRICREGLIAIGGSSAGENLVKLYRDAPKEKQQAALDVLSEITKKGPVDGIAQSVHIGKYALSNDADVSASAMNLLTSMGRAGGPGLLVALDSKIVDKKVAAMDALAAIRYYRASTRMGDFLVTGDGTALEALRTAALRSLKTMGVYTVPYLIPLLQTGSRQYASLALGEITGVRYGMNGAKQYRQWWNENKPKDAEEP